MKKLLILSILLMACLRINTKSVTMENLYSTDNRTHFFTDNGPKTIIPRGINTFNLDESKEYRLRLFYSGQIVDGVLRTPFPDKINLEVGKCGCWLMDSSGNHRFCNFKAPILPLPDFSLDYEC